MQKFIRIVSVVLICGISCNACAEQLYIPLKKGVEVSKPAERAIVSWNGYEEILINCYDIRASKPTKVLQISPFPSKPEIKTGVLDMFGETRVLINDKLSNFEYLEGYTDEDKIVELPLQLDYHEKIGVTNIKVAHFVQKEQLVNWVVTYFKEQEGIVIKIPEDLQTRIEDIMENAYTWFVFDLISVEETTKTTEPVQYRFRTKKELYYPLQNFGIKHERKDVDLYIISSRLFGIFPGAYRDVIKLVHDPVLLDIEELREFHEEMGDSLKHEDRIRCRMWQIKDVEQPFKKGVTARLGLMRL